MAASAGVRSSVRKTSAMLPTQKLPNTVQMKSGLFTNRSGPGCRPIMRSPPIITAVVADPGIPSVKSGIIAA
jgi:hypothetical protein